MMVGYMKLSPWALIYDDSNYYLETYDEDFGDLKHTRLTKCRMF